MQGRLASLARVCYPRSRSMTDLPAKVIQSVLTGLGRFSLMVAEVARSLTTQRLSGRDVMNQLYFIGVKSQTVVLVTGAFTGMVLCAQTYFQFHKVKMDTATLAVVSVSMCGELGPVLTALMVAGRVGAAMAAELGTMKVTEQIDALRTLAAHPIDYLVVPRVVATMIAVPLLTAESITVGITAAYLVGVHLLQIDPGYSIVNMQRFTDHRDVLMGFIKSFIFGGIIATTGCYKGIHCGQGAEGVGHATTEAVVYASIAILMSNFFLTLLLTRLLALT
jgi:phospholipid/cholesterol/gamma-HCH transport system permease protein